FKLLRRGIGVTILGRDIGKSLITLAKKIIPDDDVPITECLAKINAWMERECALARANGKDDKVESITDRGECLLAVAEAEGIRNSWDLREALSKLFARDTGVVTLSTIHRAKGLEWDTVVHLDPWRVPSKFAKARAAQG